MKEKDEGLDELFKKGLKDPVNEAAYRDADWDAMEQTLDKHKKRPAIIFWLPIIGSAAAVVLIVLGWLFFRPVVTKPVQNGQITKVQPHAAGNTGSDQNKKDDIKEVTGTSGDHSRQTADSSRKVVLSPENYAKNPVTSGRGQKNRSFLSLSAGSGRRDAGTVSNKTTGEQPVQTLAANPEKKNDQPDTSDTKYAVVTGVSASGNNTVTSDTSANKQITANTTPATPAKIVKTAVKPKLSNRPQFALGVIASSDLNGVNSSFAQSKVGGNFGLLFSMGLSKKWTISTGATYDIKPYLTGINNYHTSYVFQNEPVSVSANCRMLEVPVNVNYQVYSKHNNKIYLGTGLSSYFMLREDYNFNYASPYTTGPAGFSVTNKNRNILSIVNIDATYQHQVNSKVGIIIQPYLKVPLSNVGESAVRLQTSGVALGLSWNLNSLTKN